MSKITINVKAFLSVTRFLESNDVMYSRGVKCKRVSRLLSVEWVEYARSPGCIELVEMNENWIY